MAQVVNHLVEENLAAGLLCLLRALGLLLIEAFVQLGGRDGLREEVFRSASHVVPSQDAFEMSVVNGLADEEGRPYVIAGWYSVLNPAQGSVPFL